jgi:hypothetical protein
MTSSAIFRVSSKSGSVRDCLKAAASEFDHVKELAALQIKTLHEFTGQDEAVRIANFLDFDPHGSA